VAICLLAALTFSSPAGAETIVMKVPVMQDVVSCTGEVVTLTGEQTLNQHIESDATGGLHIKFSVENRGLKGVGMVSGKKYVGLDTSETEIQVPQGATEVTAVINFSLVRQGDDGTLIVGDDLRMKDLFHMTVNAMGMPTAFQSKFSNECT
jgi:hypothetical protein